MARKDSPILKPPTGRVPSEGVIVAEVYRLYTEADYDATTKTTASGASQAWDNTSSLGGLAGDMSYTIAPTKRAYVSTTYPTINAGNASVVSYRYYFNV